MKSPSPTQTTSRNLAHIALVAFLTILLIQSALGLFIPQRDDMDSVDVVFRTAISSIFGYLMSSMDRRVPSKEGDTASRTIGFSGESGTTSALPQEGETQKAPLPTHTWATERLHIHTVIIASLGLFCLGVLIFLHYYAGEISATAGVIATIAQFRDIISGSIGALIGLARGENN